MKILEKQKVIELRKTGMTLSEIQKLVPVSKSSISLWMQGIKLSQEEEKRISNKITAGQAKSRAVLYAKALVKKKEIEEFSRKFLKNFKINHKMKLVLCASLYECEGGKGKSAGVSFTNSDPYMIEVFMRLFRESFVLDERKFSICVHLHDYHDIHKQLKFWSNITKVSLNQFMKPYMKKSFHMYKKEGYEGCVNIRYYDVILKRKLLTIFKNLSGNF